MRFLPETYLLITADVCFRKLRFPLFPVSTILTDDRRFKPSVQAFERSNGSDRSNRHHCVPSLSQPLLASLLGLLDLLSRPCLTFTNRAPAWPSRVCVGSDRPAPAAGYVPACSRVGNNNISKLGSVTHSTCAARNI